MAGERLDWCKPLVFDSMEREEQAVVVVYAVERRRQDIEDLSDAVANAFARVLAQAFGKSEDEDSGGPIYIGHDPKTGERTEDARGRTQRSHQRRRD